jgi:hypothetical protein
LNGRDGGNGETLPFDVLPPAIGASPAETSEDEPAAPRRRPRRTRPAAEEGDIAPAA